MAALPGHGTPRASTTESLKWQWFMTATHAFGVGRKTSKQPRALWLRRGASSWSSSPRVLHHEDPCLGSVTSSKRRPAACGHPRCLSLIVRSAHISRDVGGRSPNVELEAVSLFGFRARRHGRPVLQGASYQYRLLSMAMLLSLPLPLPLPH